METWCLAPSKCPPICVFPREDWPCRVLGRRAGGEPLAVCVCVCVRVCSVHWACGLGGPHQHVWCMHCECDVPQRCGGCPVCGTYSMCLVCVCIP